MAKKSRNKIRAKLEKNQIETPPAISPPLSDNLRGLMEPLTTMMARYPLSLQILVLIIIMLGGMYMRLDDLTQWKLNEQKAFFNQQPIHTTFDAWFYLSLAQDLVDGTYNDIDEKRGIPDSPLRPSPPPLISVLAAAVTKITPFSLSWAGALLPVILGSLLAIPMFCLGRSYGNNSVGYFAAIFSLCYPFYIYRSNIGRFDTDCMNVTFTLMSAYVFMQFGLMNCWRRYVYFTAGILVFLLFLWWWDQTPAVVGAISFLPLLVSLIFYYRPARREGIIFGGVCVGAVIATLCVTGYSMPLEMLHKIWTEYLYISKDKSSIFPNIGITISEQSRPSLDLIVSYTTQNYFAFMFAVFGFSMLIWKKFKRSLFLISLFVLSVLAFTKANRFLIFLIPLIALGTGYAMSFLWDLLKRYQPIHVLVCGLALTALLFPLYKSNTAYTQWPKENGPIVEGMQAAREATPEDAVIWAWWDHGYALTYYARRATMNDGSLHSGERTVYNALPLATDNFRLSANFMQFYTVRGLRGIKKLGKACGNNQADALALIKSVLAAGPQEGLELIKNAELTAVGPYKSPREWLSFFYPSKTRPVYLMLDNLLTRISYWWFWFGTWNIEQQTGTKSKFKPFYNLQHTPSTITDGKSLRINKESGVASLGRNTFNLTGLSIRTRNNLERKSYSQNGTYRFEYFHPGRFGALADKRIAESVFTNLFLRYSYPKKYFKPIKIRPPYYQIWEVSGDRLN